MIQNISDQASGHAGAAGTAATFISGLAGFLAAATPVLQFLCLCISFAVGVLTAVYYVRKLRKPE